MAMAFLTLNAIRGNGAPPLTAPAPARQAPFSGQQRSAESPRSSTSLALLSLVAGSASALARGRAVSRRCADSTPTATLDKRYSPEEWVKRVKMIEGNRAVFDVTIPKPLGLIPKDFPNRPGVGVAKITKDGNTDKMNLKVIVDGEPGMWVLEGDEVVAINGESVEGESLEKVGPLVKDSEGDSVTLTLCRHYYAGPVKVVFLPSGKVATMKRGIEILKAAEIGVEDVAYSCKEGWCKACWHTDPMWGVVYRACAAVSKKRPPPKNPRTIPNKWNNVVPLWLLNRKESMKWAKTQKAARDLKRKEFEKKKKAEKKEAEAEKKETA
eukprot:TRINITY_DN107967_c0_g1_i1.p1 TRINITY_DN107967_c0_g1~~TRINITY_DN107967_c0_g1_i1.p1  ORF type:complete len:325 (-),score=59.66 TRINITY_DN107967_c0_g1_i1:119-1093(-)